MVASATSEEAYLAEPLAAAKQHDHRLVSEGHQCPFLPLEGFPLCGQDGPNPLLTALSSSHADLIVAAQIGAPSATPLPLHTFQSQHQNYFIDLSWNQII
jgi:hypothetical protein